MADRLARALNLMGADGGLLGTADSDALLDLIDDYLVDDSDPDENQGSSTC